MGTGDESRTTVITLKASLGPKPSKLWSCQMLNETQRSGVPASGKGTSAPTLNNFMLFSSGKDWGQKEKGVTGDEMIREHHWLSGLKFEQIPGDGEGQGRLVGCSPRGCKESDMTERLNNNKLWEQSPRGCESSQGQQTWPAPELPVLLTGLLHRTILGKEKDAIWNLVRADLGSTRASQKEARKTFKWMNQENRNLNFIMCLREKKN